MVFSTARHATSKPPRSRSKARSRRRPRRRTARRRRTYSRPTQRCRRRRAATTTANGRLRRQIEAAKDHKRKRRLRNAYNVIEKNVFSLISREEVEGMARDAGFTRREAKAIEPFEFVLSCVLASTVEAKRGFASVWRVFGAATGIEVARSGMTQRFGKGSAQMLRQVFEKVVERVPETTHPELLGKLEQFTQVLAHDGSVLALSSLLNKMFPATRTNSVAAAAKVHATADLVHRRITKVQITGERESELHVAWEQPVQPGALYIVDLGYYCHEYFGTVVAGDGHILSRLKESANPVIVDVDHGVRAPKQSVGKKLDEVGFVQSHRTFDLLAEFSTSAGPILLRVVGVRDDETDEYHCYVTDLSPAEFSVEEIAQLYAFRWVIELLFLQLKSFCHLDHVDTSNPDALRTHIFASLIASVVIHSLLVASAHAAGLHPSDISHLTVAAAAPLFATPLLILWMGMELTRERLARMLIQIIVVGCREQNKRRRARKWGGLHSG